jgi:sugar phosphate isomerase/epimerase
MATASLEDRCRAAAAGGFAGIGILPSVYIEYRESGGTDADLDGLLSRYGVRLAELESLSIAGPHEEADIDRQLHVHWHLAERFGADRMGVVVRPGHARAYQVHRFSQICDRAADLGVSVGIEFIPSVAAFSDITETLHFVEESGSGNGGLIVDSYHHFRGVNDWSALESLPGERVVIVQLSDAAVPPEESDYIRDTMHRRRPPGEGDFPLKRFLETLAGNGSSAPLSIEVLSDELGAMAPADQGRRLGRAAADLLQRLRC